VGMTPEDGEEDTTLVVAVEGDIVRGVEAAEAIVAAVVIVAGVAGVAEVAVVGIKCFRRRMHIHICRALGICVTMPEFTRTMYRDICCYFYITRTANNRVLRYGDLLC